MHIASDEGVEGGERLVEEPDVGLNSQGTTDADTLLLSAGELPGVVVATSVQPDEVDDLKGPGIPGGHVDTLHLEREGDVLEHCAVREQREVLEHHAHLVSAKLDQLPLGGSTQVLAVEFNLAGGRLDKARHAADEGGLSRAAQPH